MSNFRFTMSRLKVKFEGVYSIQPFPMFPPDAQPSAPDPGPAVRQGGGETIGASAPVGGQNSLRQCILIPQHCHRHPGSPSQALVAS